jgi:hypothetical protein
VVQLVNQHSQRINVLEIDKIASEDVRKGNAELVTAAKLSPIFAKEISLQAVGKLDTFSESVTGLCNNLTNHATGITLLTQPYSTSTKPSKKSIKK